MSRLSNYIKRHGRPFTLQVRNGKGYFSVQFTDGYVTLHSQQPTVFGYVQDIHLTRKAWYELLNKPELKTVSRMMEGPSFDRYKAERIYARQEQKHLEDLRRMKRDRKRESAAQSQRKRHLRARRRREQREQ